MPKSNEKIIDEVKQLVGLRKNPLVILDIKELKRVDCLKLQKELFSKKFNILDVLLQTPGGDIDAAYAILKLLRNSAKVINIIVPLYAKSAGTLICLGGDSLLMTSLSELGPLDTQIPEEQDGTSPSYTSALNGFKALEQVQIHTIETLDMASKLIIHRSGMKMSDAYSLAAEFSGRTSGTLYSQLDPKKIGEYARALEIGERYGNIILTRYMNWSDEKAEIVIKKLVKSYPSHEFIIDIEELEKIGLPVKSVAEKEELILDDLRLSLLDSKSDIIKLIEPEKPVKEKSSPEAKEKIDSKVPKVKSADNPTTIKESTKK